MSTTRDRQVAIVTGAARRIGRAIALELAQAGFRVVVHYRSSQADAEAVVSDIARRGGRAIAVGADLGDEDGRRALIAKAAELGTLAGLINNASEFRYDRVGAITPESWQLHMRTNLEAPVMLAQAFAAALGPDRQGAIVNVVDQRAWKPTPEYFSYTLSKSALWSATRMLAQAMGPHIRVNAVGPGPILQSVHQTPEEFEAERRDTLLQRVTTPEEIAAAVRFLLDASAVTGQMIALDAGQHLTWPFEGPPAQGPDAGKS
jgi:NAD(P)-dependent dehydrogenase (short-subunit alcohol dehydrogenase family)